MVNVNFLQFALAKGIGEVSIKRALNFLMLNYGASWKDIISNNYILNLNVDIFNNIKKTYEDAKLLEETLLSNNVDIILENDINYPKKLKLILGDEAPPFLFIQGNKNILDKNGIGFCGSRKVSEKGKEITNQCAKILSNNYINVISGYASGTDLTAHQSSLINNGATIFVLAEGILRKTIKGEIKDYINNDNHIFISQFLPRLTWNAGNAMKRNKTIIGLSLAMILIEAREYGGTFEAGIETLKLNRNLFVIDYFMPPETAKANRLFISKGGIPIKKNKQGLPVLRSVLDKVNNDSKLLERKDLEPKFNFMY